MSKLKTANELRQEAIKWIKLLKDKQKSYETFVINEKESLFRIEDGYDNVDMDDYEPVIIWVKHFFNITEEDLK